MQPTNGACRRRHSVSGLAQLSYRYRVAWARARLLPYLIIFHSRSCHSENAAEDL